MEEEGCIHVLRQSLLMSLSLFKFDRKNKLDGCTNGLFKLKIQFWEIRTAL